MEEEPIIFELGNVGLSVTGKIAVSADLEFWSAGTYAAAWFSDALAEASKGGVDARRREIVFALATVESYLFEWVRDEILNKDFKSLDTYFPTDKHRDVLERWKEVQKDLLANGKISRSQNFNGAIWNAFVRLVHFRNGLLHGSASRPVKHDPKSGFKSPRKLLPSIQELEELQSGWAVGVVRGLVTELHTVAGTPSPTWLHA